MHTTPEAINTIVAFRVAFYPSAGPQGRAPVYKLESENKVRVEKQRKKNGHNQL